MGLSFTVLGCSGSYAAPGGACTGYLLQSDRAKVWLDAGPGTLANLQDHVRVGDVDALVLTHEHPDHWLELPILINVLKHFLPRPTPLPVYLTAGTKLLLEAFGQDAQTPAGPLDLRILTAASQVSIGDQQWQFSRTDHPVETLATHVTSGGARFAFSSDTGPGWRLTEFSDRIDLALVEASLPNRHEWPDVAHLTAGEAAERAAGAEARNLVLTHLPPGANPRGFKRQAESVFGQPVEIARVGATFTV